MGIWDVYGSRIEARGVTKRDASLKRETRIVEDKSKAGLSYKQVTIDDVFQRVIIIDSYNLNEKTIISLPMEDIKLGGLVPIGLSPSVMPIPRYIPEPK